MKDAGKIVPRERGDYDPNATYEILDFVYYNGASYIAKTTTTGNVPARDNEYWHILVSGMDVTSVVTGAKGDSETDYRRGEVNITKSDIGLGNVQDMTPAQIRAGLTTQEIEDALGYSISDGLVTGVKGEAETDYRAGDVNITKANIGLGNVQNLSPEEILDELTAENVENALGYSPSEVSIEVDSSLSDTSTNPVQNQAIAGKIYELIDALSELDGEQKNYTDTKIAELIGGAPETLDTLGALADAIQANEPIMDALNAAIGGKVDKVTGKGLSTNDYTTADKEKLAGLVVNNAKLTIQKNGTQVGTFTANQGTDVTVNIAVPTKTSELTDDVGFGSASITVDSEMSETSTNPVQNKVITAYINKLKGSTLHGFRINQAESDPDNIITYIEDSVLHTPAYMDYEKDVFNYGGWDREWFLRNLMPCMLNYDGSVAYELNKGDYAQKKGGGDSDNSNVNFAGNAMIGMPKVFWKIAPKNNDVADIFFCDENMDGSFHCWSHLNANGNEIPYCYMSIYNGSLVSNRLRSLSGQAPMASKTVQQEVTYAKANNLSNSNIWYTEVFSDRILINLLLLLIGKSTDMQTVFGYGNSDTYVSQSNNGFIATGSMNNKGLFWGESTGKSGVKVFGIEHWWGNVQRRLAGLINANGVQKVKMTYGQSDGSTVDGYNFDGTGYIVIPNATPSGTHGGYISKMIFDSHGLLPKVASGSATTYYCDALFFNNNQNNYAFAGGTTGGKLSNGAVYFGLDRMASEANWSIGASLSCKPLA